MRHTSATRSACPLAVNQTAAGSHAGPAGPITTSSRVPPAVPASAACSTAPNPATAGSRRRRHPPLGPAARACGGTAFKFKAVHTGAVLGKYRRS